jgi:hypothetical protein
VNNYDTCFLAALTPKGSLLDALRICCLFLSPPQRRKLTLFLRAMHKMIGNQQLVIHEHLSTRQLVRLIILLPLMHFSPPSSARF